jgi:hypothetical protein
VWGADFVSFPMPIPLVFHPKLWYFYILYIFDVGQQADHTNYFDQLNGFMKHAYWALLITVLACTNSYGWDDCPFGLVNDRYPGKCGLYEDSNHDSICDHSQHQLMQVAVVTDSALLKNTAQNHAPRVTQGAKSAAAGRRSVPVIPANVLTPPVPVTTEQSPPAQQSKAPSPLRQRYPLWQIFLITAIAAIATEMLTAYNKKLALPLQTAWNWALLLSFLLTVAFCVPFVYPALLTSINFNLAYWHSLTGLAMIAIGLYHFIRRWGAMWRGARSWFGRNTVHI